MVADERIAHLVEDAFLAGYRHGVESFSVWRAGAQVVGTLERSLSEVFRRAPDDCREAYRMFLQSKQKRHDGEERSLAHLEDCD